MCYSPLHLTSQGAPFQIPLPWVSNSFAQETKVAHDGDPAVFARSRGCLSGSTLETTGQYLRLAEGSLPCWGAVTPNTEKCVHSPWTRCGFQNFANTLMVQKIEYFGLEHQQSAQGGRPGEGGTHRGCHSSLVTQCTMDRSPISKQCYLHPLISWVSAIPHAWGTWKPGAFGFFGFTVTAV